MPAVFVNTATVLAGSLIGILFRNRLKESLRNAVMKALGLCTLLIGVSSAVGTKNLLCVIVCMVVGTVLGELLRIDDGIEHAGDAIKAKLLRGKSGGGAIFADEDNIMVSLVTGSGTVEKVFKTFSQEIARSLSRLGAPMKVSGRNDICIVDGRKICGGAFYHLPNRNIVHCTMLYDTNMPLMQGCLTPARAKLESKGVKSVPSRIGLLKEYFEFGVQELRRRLADQLTNRSVLLTKEQVRSIEEIEKAYHEPTYIYGKPRTAEAKPALILSRRIEGCGKLDMYIYMSDGHISDLRLDGDFFETGESSALEAFRSAFIGQPFDRTALQAAIAHHHPERSIRGLEREKLLELLTTQASSQI